MSNERNSLPERALAQESGERRHERTELLDSREYQASNEMQTLLELGLDIVESYWVLNLDVVVGVLSFGGKTHELERRDFAAVGERGDA